MIFYNSQYFRQFNLFPLQVERLDIIADVDAATQEYIDVLKHKSAIFTLDVCVNIHWSFYIRNAVDLEIALEVCQQENVG